MIGVVVSRNSQRVVDMFLLLNHLLLAVIIFNGRPSYAVLPIAPQCSVQTLGPNPGSLHQQWVYTAPPRFVPAPPVDPALQQEFFRLFQYDNITKQSVLNAALPAGISQNDLSFIASVCPKDAFFYSMSPQHVQARALLQQYFAAQPTPRDLLQVAKIILHNHEINPKIWYYALMGATMERPDMNGITIAQPLDAIPDSYIPAPVLFEVLSHYRPVYGVGDHIGFGNGVGGGGRGGRHIDRLGGFDDEHYFHPHHPHHPHHHHYGAASSVNEHRVKFDRSLDSSNGSSSYVLSSEMTSAEKFEKRRRTIIKRKPKKGKSNQPQQQSKQPSFDNFADHDHHDMDDSAGSESIAVTSRIAPNKLIKDDDEDSEPSTTSTSKSVESQSTEDGNFAIKLSFGEDDDEYDELRRIHDTSNDTTKLITQRILQRRQRRKNDKKPRREKRQLFGSPHHHHPIRECTVINGSVGVDNGIENKLWYFREDPLVNQHHWYWHQMYPVNATRHGDRRAELFFYTHRNLVARYNAERLSNGMPRTVELLLRHGTVIDNGYNAHLIDMHSGKYWTPRTFQCVLDDILHEQDPDFARNILLKDLSDLFFKLIYSIRDGALIGPNQQRIPLRNFQGIDNLGNTVEATELSMNPLYYDSVGFHNLGHQLLGLIQDPHYVQQLPTGVMAEQATTMRDPAFYTFHAGIDNIFDRYKRTLPPYQLYGGDFPLVWTGVAISSVVITPNLNDGHVNHIRTFWTMNRFPLESGIDNSIHNGDIREDICATHLNHEPFNYKITVNVNPCTQSATSQGTVRLYMAPRYDEYGQRFPLKVQRRLMFQLDVFPAQLHSGRNVIIRRSQDSSLTKPWPESLGQLAYQKANGPNSGAADYCGCGWPRHLLIPKGNPHGMEYDLFVMITNLDQDIVQNTVEDLKIPESCNSPYLMCGIPWRRYPDAKPMGYPFDRVPYKVPVSCGVATGYPNFVCKTLQPQWFRPVETLEEFVHPAPNMASTIVVVQHVDTLI